MASKIDVYGFEFLTVVELLPYSCCTTRGIYIIYIVIRQQDWRRPVSLVVDRIGYLSTRFLAESLVYILRENSGRTEELNWILVYPQRCFGLSIRIRLWALIDITFELDK